MQSKEDEEEKLLKQRMGQRATTKITTIKRNESQNASTTFTMRQRFTTALRVTSATMATMATWNDAVSIYAAVFSFKDLTSYIRIAVGR